MWGTIAGAVLLRKGTERSHEEEGQSGGQKRSREKRSREKRSREMRSRETRSRETSSRETSREGKTEERKAGKRTIWGVSEGGGVRREENEGTEMIEERG